MTEPKKILVVDDDKAVTALLQKLFADLGYRVITAHDGLDAMLQVKNHALDLIVLDIMMPELNGYDVCSHLKFDDKFKHIPIIVLTSRSEELDPRIGRLMGISYLQKPIDSQALLCMVQKALNG